MQFSPLLPSPAPHPYAIPMRIVELAEYAASGPLEPMPNRSQLIVVWGGKGALHLYEHQHKVARGFALLGRSGSQAVAIGLGTSLQGLYIEFVHYPPSAADNRSRTLSLASRRLRFEQCRARRIILAAGLRIGQAIRFGEPVR